MDSPVSFFPRLHVERRRGDRGNRHRPANLPGRENLLHPHDDRIEPPVVGNSETDAVFPASGNHRIALRDAPGHRFLDEHVLAGPGCRQRLPQVAGNGSGDVNGVDLRIGE
jgi:hypothetical protein